MFGGTQAEDDAADDDDADWSTIVPELLSKRMSPLLEALVDTELDKLSDGYIRKVRVGNVGILHCHEL
jgi:hypothetical protein